MKEGAENVQTRIQAKAESVLKQGADSSRSKLVLFYLIGNRRSFQIATQN